MSLVISTTVRNWYQNDVSFSLELIKTFIDGIESQAADSVETYQVKKQVSVIGSHPYESLRTEYQGLDNETWDLPTIFEEYFPSLQRRSGLLTLCSYFEHEMDRLCSLYRSEKGFNLSHVDLRGHGIHRATQYLEKVAGLNVHRTSNEWRDIDAIQKLRNLLVHSGGTLNKQSNGYKEISGLRSRVESLRENAAGEILLGRGFLVYVLEAFASYCRLIGESIGACESVESKGGPVAERTKP
jgi:hypothetical protein